MFAQIIDGRIVRVSETAIGGDVELDLPEDFDFDHIDSYEVTESGLVKHDLPAPEAPESPYVTWDALEKALKEGSEFRMNTSKEYVLEADAATKRYVDQSIQQIKDILAKNGISVE